MHKVWLDIFVVQQLDCKKKHLAYLELLLAYSKMKAIIMIYMAMLLPLISGLTIDASKYSPEPPTEVSAVSKNMEIEFPYTQRYSRAFNRELIECMKKIELSNVNIKVYESKFGSIFAQCYFIQTVLDECQQFESQEGNFWFLKAAKQDLSCDDIKDGKPLPDSTSTNEENLQKEFTFDF